MFNLEEAITDWRKKMLAAGIKTPAPLDELEIHLREEIEQRVRAGGTAQQAFELATAQIGQADSIKTEFKKSGGCISWLGENNTGRTNRVFALLWLASCSWMFFTVAAPILAMIYGRIFYGQRFGINFDLLLILLIEVILLRGIIASILLFAGKNGLRTIRFIAVLGLVAAGAQIISFKTFSILAIAMTAFNIASIWLLRPPQKPQQATN